MLTVCPAAGFPGTDWVQDWYPVAVTTMVWPGVPVVLTSTMTGDVPTYLPSNVTDPVGLDWIL